MKKMVFPLFILFFAAAIVGAYLWGARTPSDAKREKLKVGDSVFNVEVRDTALGRVQGLSGRDNLPDGTGMLFIFSDEGEYGFWMKGMRFSIDIVWIRGDKVVGFAENVAPEPEKNLFALTAYHPPEPVQRVLELPAGAIKQYGLKIGDVVEVQ